MSIQGNASNVSFEDMSFNSFIGDAKVSDDRKRRLLRSRSTSEYQGISTAGERQMAFEVEQMQKQSADVDAMLERCDQSQAGT